MNKKNDKNKKDESKEVEMTDGHINDIFMLSTNKLNELTKVLASNKSPN